MHKPWFGIGILVISIAVAPFVANALWRRGISQPVGYVVGFVVFVIGALVMRLLGGLPPALR